MLELKEVLEERFGSHRVNEIPAVDGKFSLLVIDLELNSPVTVLMTNGLSDYKMPVHEKLAGREYNELYFCLPNYWEWDAIDNPKMNWVYEWIERIAKHAVDKQTWFAPGHTLPAGKEENALSETMLQNNFFISDPLLLERELEAITIGDKTIHFLAIIPIFKDEMNYKQARGTFKFLQKLATSNTSEKLDDFRGSVLKRRWLRR